MLRIDNVKIFEDLELEELKTTLCKKYNISLQDVEYFSIYKKSIDARDKENVYYNYTFNIALKDERKFKKYSVNTENKLEEKLVKNRKSKFNPVIVGAGPSGLFCALELVEYGIQPIIIEQGSKVEKRIQDVDNYIKTGKVNTKSNVQFGEGGAGTFSDGKLTTGINDKNCKKVLENFVKFGAPKQILYINKPHIGTDNLVNIVANIRKYIESKGGQYIFDTKVVDIVFENNKVTAVVCDDGQIIKTDTVVLAIGHSARDTFKLLKEKNIKMEKKNFSVGVRIEHLQNDINNSQYGTHTKLNLPPAEYKLVYHGNDRSCYSFCMCPGGTVMPSASEEDAIVTNGMSKYNRDLENANAALLVNVLTEDFKTDDVLEGMYFQEKLEKEAYILGGKSGKAPAQKLGDFLNNIESTEIGKIKPSYMPGVKLTNLNELLPDFVAKTLKEAIMYWDKKIHGFADSDAILTAIETRSSSPIKIIRNDKFMAENIQGLYPAGEGPGYAGGIMSAAVDGIKIARAIIIN